MKKSVLYLFFFLSGVSGLGYEILWTRMLSASLGHEIVSVLAVISAFFSGLALGAWFLDLPVSHSAVPGKWYTMFELIIGLWALVLLYIMPELNSIVIRMIGVAPSPLRHWFISFFYPFAVLLPATVAMGGTLPAIDRFFEKSEDNRRAVAGLYSINTFGAVTGTMLVTFFLMPAFGMHNTSVLLASVNFICAAGIFLLSKKNASDQHPEQNSINLHTGAPKICFILFITGLLGIGFEVLMVRALSQILENTIYSFASMLLVFLLGTAIGAGIYQKIKLSFAFENSLSLMLLSTAFFCTGSIFMLRYMDSLFGVFRKASGEGLYGAVVAEIFISLLFFMLPAASMGATFSHIAQSLKRQDCGVGRALCLNTLGGAIAPFLFGVWLLPGIGIKYALLIIPAAYILCMPRFHPAVIMSQVLLVIVILFVAQNHNRYQFVSLSAGDKLLSYKEGIMASVSVVKDKRNGLHLMVNNHFQMGGTTSAFSDRRQAYLPLLLHPKPQKALFLGLGTGITFSAASDFPELKAVGVELIPEVIEAMDYFKDTTGKSSENGNLQIVNADARRYVSSSDQKYDVVIADLFHPARDGAGSLYTMEHFRAIRNLLSENGLFCQWLPLYQLDLEMFKVITKTFMRVFPDGQAYLAYYSIDQPIIGLVGGKHRLRFDENWYIKRMQGTNFQKHMAGFGYDSIYSLIGAFMAGGDALRHFAGDSPVNTDEYPVVLFQAPSFVYRNPEPAKKRLSVLLSALSPPNPESILSEKTIDKDHMVISRLTAYWSARDSFLELGMRVERTNNVAKLYETAVRPLLDIFRRSTDFTTVYFPLISIAYKLYPHDRNASYRLLYDLEKADPLRSEAGFLKHRLFNQ